MISYKEKALQKKRHTLLVFFDLEIVWRAEILNNLYALEIMDNLQTFFQNFLTNKKFNVRVRVSCSKFADRDDGGPSGQHT